MEVSSFIKCFVTTTLLSLLGAIAAIFGLYIMRGFVGYEGVSVFRAVLYCVVVGIPSLLLIIEIALKMKMEEAQPFRVLLNKLLHRA